MTTKTTKSRSSRKGSGKRRYAPTSPYIFGDKAEYPGKSIEEVMFFDYLHLRRIVVRLKENGVWNDLRHHLHWVFRRGEDRLQYCERILCPQCGKNPVSQFAARISRSGEANVGIEYTCCGFLECTSKIQAQGQNCCLVLPLQFSMIRLHDSLTEVQHDLGEVFRQAFKLPKDLTPEITFQFFSAGPQLDLF